MVKMVAVGNLHNTRMLRFLLVLIVVIVPIFIYALYSTTTTMTPTHLHTQMAMPTPQQIVAAAATSRKHSEQVTPVLGANNNNTVELSPFTGDEISGHSNKARLQDQHRKQQHRLPTIDEDALLDGGAGGASPMAGSEQASNVADELLEEQQYVQSIDAITGEQLQLIELIEYGC